MSWQTQATMRRTEVQRVDTLLRQVSTTLVANILSQAPPVSPARKLGAGATCAPGARSAAATLGVDKATLIARPGGEADSARPSDHALVARVLGGDLDAFAAILARHQNRVHSIAAQFAANADDASDLAQEVFLKAYRSLPRFRGQAAFSTWLYRIAVNACVDYARRRRRVTWLPLEDDLLAATEDAGLDPQEEMERGQLRSDLARAVRTLSTKLRVALILHDIEGLTHEEIAHIVGCSVGTTKSRLFRAREEVRRRLREQTEGNHP